MLPVLLLLATLATPPIQTPRFLFISNSGSSSNIYLSEPGHEPKLFLKNADYPSLSPNGKQLSFLRNGAAWVRDLKSNREWQVTGKVLEHDKHIDPTDHEFTPTWTHDGKMLLISVPNRLQIRRIGQPIWNNEEDFRQEIQTWAIYRVPIDLAEQKELNRERVYGEQGHEFQLKPTDHPMDLLFGPSIHGFVGWTEIVSSACPSVSPDGKHVAFCRNGDLWLSDVNTSGSFDEIMQPRAARIWSNYLQESGSDNYSSFIYRISWSPSGKLLAASTYRYGGSDRGAITILKVGDKAVEKQVVTGHTGVFVDEDHIMYSTIGTTGIYLRSLRSGKVILLASQGYWPMPLPGKA